MERALAQHARQFVEPQHTQSHLVTPVIERPVTIAALLIGPHSQRVLDGIFHHQVAQLEAPLDNGFPVPAAVQCQREVQAFLYTRGIAVDREKDIGTAVGGKRNDFKQVQVILSRVGLARDGGLIALVSEDFYQGEALGQIRVGFIVVYRVLAPDDPCGHVTVVAVMATMAGVDEHAGHILAADGVLHFLGLTLASGRSGWHCWSDVQLQLTHLAAVEQRVNHLATCRHGLHCALVTTRDGLAHLAIDRQQPDARPAGTHIARIAHGDDVIVVVPAGHEELTQIADDLPVQVTH